jgi:polyisoprenoid-binding protein YceI
METTSKHNVSVESSTQSNEKVPTWVKVGLGLGVLGLVAWGARWLIQGGDVIYTDVARAFWVADPLQGWVETADRWVWLGLEGLGAVLGVVVGTTGMLVAAAKFKHTTAQKVATVASRLGAVVAMAAPILPAWAFVSGMPPAGAQRLLPLNTAPVAQGEPRPESKAGFAVVSGKWQVADSKANLLAARVTAGGETFDGKFGPISGEVELVAERLGESKATFSVPATSIDTGVELRNTHAQGYLDAENHKTISLVIPKLDSVTAGANEAARAFSTEGELTIMGKPLKLPVTGTLVLLTAAERTELGVTSNEAVLVSASFVLPVLKTPLDRKNFDVDELPLTVRLVIAPSAGTTPAAGAPR